MTDTPPEIKQRVREQIRARSGEERFVRGAQMFDPAIEMIKASPPPDLSETQQKRQLFKRLYGRNCRSKAAHRWFCKLRIEQADRRLDYLLTKT